MLGVVLLLLLIVVFVLAAATAVVVAVVVFAVVDVVLDVVLIAFVDEISAAVGKSRNHRYTQNFWEDVQAFVHAVDIA